MWEEGSEKPVLPTNQAETQSRVEAFVGMYPHLTAEAASGEQFHSFNKYLPKSHLRELLSGFEKMAWWQKGLSTCLQGCQACGRT